MDRIFEYLKPFSLFAKDKSGIPFMRGANDMARDCCWNCKFYIAKGDNEPALLASTPSNVCVFSDKKDDKRNWVKRACPTPPGYFCKRYQERFY